MRAEAKATTRTKGRKAHIEQVEVEQLFGEMEQVLEEALKRKKRKPAWATLHSEADSWNLTGT